MPILIATFIFIQNLGRKVIANNRSMRDINARDVIWKHCQLKSLEHIPVDFTFAC